MWTCPTCNRPFKKNNQSHGCHILTVKALLSKRSPFIQELYQVFDAQIVFEDSRREVVLPDVIFYKIESTFLTVKLKTKWIDINFFNDELIDHSIIKKSKQTSKNRFVHVVSIDATEDINQELLDWIRNSYQLIKSS